jgi:3-keto-L-gulonate-6-phosphate decarboxylase
MLDRKIRYLQIAFNNDLDSVNSILPTIAHSNRIIIEAGTPFIKREGFDGIERISEIWKGHIVADLKTMDGAIGEVELAYNAGATAATVMGSASIETINLFIQKCNELELDSMIDMLDVEEPLKVLMKLKKPPSAVILHKGRDEESTRGKVIPYKQVNKVRSKYDCLISAAGGVDLKEARSAIFNGANIVVVNLVARGEAWTGIKENDNVAKIAEEFLKTIE